MRTRKCKPGSRTAPLPPPRRPLCGAAVRHRENCVRPRGTANRPSDAASEAMVLMRHGMISNRELEQMFNQQEATHESEATRPI